MLSHLLRPEIWLDKILEDQSLTIGCDASIEEAIAAMNQARSSYILIIEGRKLEGIFTERDVVKFAGSPLSRLDVPISQAMTRNPLCIERDRLDNIFKAIDLMRVHCIHYLPIVDSAENLLGTITPERIRAILQPTDLLEMRRVVDVVSDSAGIRDAARVLSVPATASALETVQLMLDTGKSSIVIVAPTADNTFLPIGILTERDIVRFKANKLDLASLSCGEVMSSPVFSVSLETTLWKAHEIMRDRGIRRLAIVADSGALTGIVTQSNILQALDPAQLRLTVQQMQLIVSQTIQELQETNERLKSELQQRQQIEEQLRQLNQRLEEQSQRQLLKLIHSEKMAALGQLMAGIAHDLSGPISAMKVSASNLSEGFGIAKFEKLLAFLQSLPPEVQKDFWLMIGSAKQTLVRRSRRHIVQLQDDICQQLEEESIDGADEIAEILVEIGIEDSLEQFKALLRHPNCEQTLDWVVQLVGLQKSLQVANTATEQTVSAITALKNYVRQDFTEEKIPARITEGIDTVLTLYQNAFKHGIELHKNCDESLPEILCYPSDLKQVWMNLIQNSLYAMAGQGTLTIEVQRQDDFVRVHIQDSGTGIPKEIQETIFQPFFTTKPLGEGGGLGLNIVKQIIEKHEGIICLNSVPGKTIFTILLPFKIPT
nr:CBS domain-containing protein [Oscillatoria sp. FACHB-1406]